MLTETPDLYRHRQSASPQGAGMNTINAFSCCSLFALVHGIFDNSRQRIAVAWAAHFS
jgi:hypothetical protein